VFDTQLAATLVGLGDQISYAAAVEQLLGRRLDKAQARTDWEQRPLKAEQLRYAFDDVVYLGEMYLMLAQRLRDSGRRSWLEPDFSRLCQVQTYRPDPLEQWRKVRGQQNLKGVRLAVLREISAWRERLAMQLDKPRRWVLKDEVLVEIARRMPRDDEAMARIRGLDKAALARYGTQLAALVGEAASQPAQRWPVAEPAREVPSQEQSALVDMLMAIVRLKADSQNVTPAALASRRDLERLVLGERDLDVLCGWRSALVGNDLLAALDGRLWPRLVDGRLRLEGRATD
jgi:ribonuclease D